jgi:hypothetical protein
MSQTPTVHAIEVHPLAKCCWCGSSFVRGAVKILGLEPWTCSQEACWRRQIAHAMVVTLKGRPRNDLGGNKRCRFVPLPRQVEAIEALQADGPVYVMIGGAAGGSKSKGLREIAHAVCMTTPNFRVLLLRRTFKELESNHILDAQMEAPEMGAECVPSAKVVRYPNGSQLQFGHCETAADAANYLSSEYDLIIFDELVTFEETQFLLISSRARSTKPGVVPKVMAGTNPGGPQSHWVRMRFIDHNVDTNDYPDYVPEEWLFIPSKLEDNPYLDRNYEKKLLALPPELRKAYRDGDWDIFPGQYFPEWRKAVHVADLPVPPGARWYRAIDWGYINPGSCLWIAMFPEGRAYIRHEWNPVRVINAEQAKTIANRTRDYGIKVLSSVADTGMWTPDGDSGESPAETYARYGVPLQQADKERVAGWARLRHWLSLAPDGKPWLMVHPDCAYLIRTLPSLVSAKHKPEDVDSTGEDHSADALRYFVMSRPSPGAVTNRPSLPEWSLGWLKQQAQKPRGVLAPRSVHAG